MTSIFEDIAFGPRNLGLSEEAVNTRVHETLGMLNIERLRARSPMKLSGGEKRIAAIAAVLAMRPSVILFDEPTAFLDPRARKILGQLLKDLPLTKLVATHDLAFAARLCERAIILKEGAIAADGLTLDLLSDQVLMQSCGLEPLE
jgi:cobalt/nickel transport system ATP-binding protein